MLTFRKKVLPMKIHPLLLPAFFIGLAALPIHAHPVEDEMAEGAKNLLAALSPEQHKKACFDFAEAERKNWHFIPRARLGLPLKEMSHEQRLLAQALLSSGMSSRGYGKAVTVMSLEAILAELEKGQPGKPLRDSENYFVSIFGKPGSEAPWGWRFEGHHLSLNFTCTGKGPSVTPAFFGANPGKVKEGPRAGLRVLSREEDLGRELATSLTPAQREQAVVSKEVPKDIINDPGRVEMTVPEGIGFSALQPEQQKILQALVREYLNKSRPEVADAEWERISKSELKEIKFGWVGGTEVGAPHYYRVQGSSFLVEYDNTQNGANHPHAVWRDRNRDFGVDLLKEHYSNSHKK